MDEDIAVFQNSFHGVGVGDEIGREISLVELHTFNDIQSGFQSLGFFNGDGTFLTDFGHGFGNDVTDGGVSVGGDGGNLGDFVADTGGDGSKFFHNSFNGFLNAAFEFHGVAAGGDVLETFAVDGFSQNSCRGGTVTGDIIGLAGDFFDHLGTHVGIGAGQFNFFGDRDTVFGDLGSAEFFVKNDVASLGSESGFDSLGKQCHTFENAATGFI